MDSRGAARPDEGRRPASEETPHAAASKRERTEEERERAEELRALARLLEGAEGSSGARFELGLAAGRSPFGERFLATDAQNHARAVLLLVLDPGLAADPELLPRLAQLVARSAELDHPSIARLREVVLDERGRILLASELVEGEDVRTLVERKGALPPRHALEIARQILAALEAAHARGSPHGTLLPETVLLARRVPWTEENPFGVGVRLVELGLAAELGTQASVEGDLAAVGALLGELLTGTRVAPDGSDWPVLRASVRTPALRELIDRALMARVGRDARAQRAGPVTSAREFREAIESAREWRGTSVRAWQMAGFAGLAAGLVFLALYLREREGGVQAATRDLERMVASLEEEEKTGAAERERLNAQLLALDRERSALSERERGSEGEREALAARATELERSLAANAVELEAARGELDALRRAGSSEALVPAALAATTLDRLLEHVERGDLAAGARLLEAAQADATLVPLGFGAGFLEGWIEAEAELRAAESALAAPDAEPSLAGLESLVHARAGLARAEDRRESFVVRSASWIDRPVDGGEGRRERIERALAELARRHEELAAALGPELEARWDALTATCADEPAEVVALARWRGGDELEHYVGRLDAQLERALEKEGRLDLEALQASAALARWAELLADERFPAAVDVALFALARRYAFPPDALEAAPPLPAHLPRQLDGWREELVLRARALAEDSAFPGSAGSRALYFARSSDGEESWTLETVRASPGPGGAARWVIEQRCFDAAGRATLEREIAIEREAKRFFEVARGRRELVDLAWGAAEVRPYSPELGARAPVIAGISETDVRSFQVALDARAPRALVLESNGQETWIAPELGLVRARIAGRIERELVFADLAR